MIGGAIIVLNYVPVAVIGITTHLLLPTNVVMAPGHYGHPESPQRGADEPHVNVQTV